MECGLSRWLGGKESACRSRRTWVRSLGQKDPLEREMAPHSSIPGWRIPRTEEPGRLQSAGSQRVGHDCSGLAQSSHLPVRFRAVPLLEESRLWFCRFLVVSSVFACFEILTAGKKSSCRVLGVVDE